MSIGHFLYYFPQKSANHEKLYNIYKMHVFMMLYLLFIYEKF